MGEDVPDLADRDDGSASARRSLQNIAIGRRHGEILAIGGARKVLGARADEGAGDNPTDVKRIAQTSRDVAKIIKPLESEGLLVRGDLQNRVGGCVADWFQRPQVLLAIIV